MPEDKNVTIKQFDELPPSAKLIFRLLEGNGFMTQQEIVEETALPPRTVRYALERLKKEDMLNERPYLKDTRKTLYGVSDIQEGRHFIADFGCMCPV
jgi:DNA-binding MarR family transcriptional regulator